MATFSKAARDLRRMLKPPPPVITQRQLAVKLGVTQQAVSAWLHGIARPDPERMAKIEELLGVPMRDWVVESLDPDDTDDPTPADESGEHSALPASDAGTGTEG